MPEAPEEMGPVLAVEGGGLCGESEEKVRTEGCFRI